MLIMRVKIVKVFLAFSLKNINSNIELNDQIF